MYNEDDSVLEFVMDPYTSYASMNKIQNIRFIEFLDVREIH